MNSIFIEIAITLSDYIHHVTFSQDLRSVRFQINANATDL